MMNNKRLLFILLFLGSTGLIACKKTEIEPLTGKSKLSIAGQAFLPNANLNLNFELTNWMEAIPDTTSIAQLSIPGTHNSGARVDALGTENTSRCQDLSISEQLAIGVRFLDIRCHHINDTFTIHHGLIYQKLTFNDVLNSCIDFLNSNPSETIIMSVNEEHAEKDGNTNSRSFEDTFNSYVQKNPGKWDLSTQISSLGSLRGKIKLLRRFKANSTIGLDATDWKNNQTFVPDNLSASLKIQDQYSVSSGEAKWASFQSLLNEAKKDNSNKLYINFGSGQRDIKIINLIRSNYTRAGSDYVNPQLKTLFTNGVRGKYGIIPLDFIDIELSKKIIMTNSSLFTTLSKYVNGWNEYLSYPSPSNDKQYFDIWLPANRDKNKTRLFIFIHGGSFLNGDKRAPETMPAIDAIKSEFPNYAIATINYRVGPAITMSQHVEDVKNAVNEIVQKSEEMNISNQQIILVGESAGAYLAFYEGLKNNINNGSQARYKAIVSISGFANMLPEMSNNFYNTGGTIGLAKKVDSELLKKDIKIKIDANPLGWIGWDWLTKSTTVDVDPQRDYRNASYKWSPVQWIPEREEIPELYVFYGNDDEIIETTESRKIGEYVNRNPRSEVKSKLIVTKSYPGQGHTMNEATKKDLAKILKEKIIYF